MLGIKSISKYVIFSGRATRPKITKLHHRHFLEKHFFLWHAQPIPKKQNF
jgi:hypothetical protein